MHAVGFGGERDIDAVVDQQRHAEPAPARRVSARASSTMARVRAVLVAQLHQRRAAGDQRGEIGKRAAAGDGGIDNRIEAQIDVHQVTFAARDERRLIEIVAAHR